MIKKKIDIIEYPVPEEIELHFIMDLQHQTYGHSATHRYFLAFETAPTVPVSVLWHDLEFLSTHFGVTRFDKDCDITAESLNEGRITTLVRMRDMIERNISPLDYDDIKENGMVNYTDGYGKPKSITYKAHVDDDGTYYPEKTVSEYEPRKLSRDAKKEYEADIARGLYVLCAYVRSEKEFQKRKIFVDDVID